METRKIKLTQRSVEAAKPGERRYVVSDSEIPGFRLQITPSGKKSFYFAYRVGGGRGATQREPKIGDWPAMKAEKARGIAEDWAAQVRLGGDPGGDRRDARAAPRMSDLFTRYLTDHAEMHKKASSVANDRRLIEKRLIPALGKRKIAEVTRDEIARLHRSLAMTPYEANRMLSLLSKAFNLAEIWGWRPDASNPCRHVRKYREEKRTRFLSETELARLGEVLRRAEMDGFLLLPPRAGKRDTDKRIPISRYAVAATRLLILTGARTGEILGLKWDWIDLEDGIAKLPDSKTGEKAIMLPPPALAVLDQLPRIEGNPHVIVGGKLGAALVNLKKPWGAIREAAGLEEVRGHDLRHGFASIGAASGLTLETIGALLGHSQPSTTLRYVHFASNPLKAAASGIGGRIEAAMRISGISPDSK